ncbi:molybdopterin-dependent oxidoreductase [Shewanella woodyi]|uniref:Molydopterin dinucleotide-binding region n=1 Tax=Shewanella woodyi (strain ATCC 51908 / MS32) TaxID=392500 RepID=B1KFX6_SHEWM|nr:molybdopterin-dependent oxidoreductase [Shewanella woodyi]ACA86683.1 molydopterin dinucleotide-binding region [Shewanella woodyi ATCC 51908]
MAYVVTGACIGDKHTSCVDVCPVNAFREGEEMLYIDPDECISCNACLTECPSLAIFPEASVPEDQLQYININAIESKKHPVITERINKQPVKETDVFQSNKRFAVIGSGPSGFFASEALLKQYPGGNIDIIEKLPVPFGLVRFGVAPDHPKIKSVSKNFTNLMKDQPSLKFFGNVEVGKDLDRDYLLNSYDAVIYTTGGSSSKTLNIPGNELSGVYGSAEFVGWYNGHPEQKTLAPNLNSSVLSIIGMGNVALDIARTVCLPHDELHRTDVAQHALDDFLTSDITHVNIIARKGPAQAAFTPKELQQLIDHPDINIEVDENELVLDDAMEASLSLPENSEANENIQLLRSIATRESNGSKTIRFMFNRNPEELKGQDGAVTHLKLGVNQVSLDGDDRLQVNATGETEWLETGVVVTATGYKGTAIKGLAFDDSKGVISNVDGQAKLSNGQLSDKEFVAGWIKRGASGVIGTNKSCAVGTVNQLVSILDQTDSISEQASLPPLKKYLSEKGVNYFSVSDWAGLDAYEIQHGERLGRTRQKLVDLADMEQVKKDNANLIAKATPEYDEPIVKEFDASKPVKKHHRTCTLCEAMCGIVVEYQGEKIVSISGDEKDQHSFGHICPKGYALQDLHNDPDRIKTPKKRIGDQWVDMDWDEALEEVAQRLVATQEKYGNDSVAGYWGNPSSHNIECNLTVGPFRKALKSKNYYSASSLDQMPHQLTSYLMYGHGMSFTIPDIDRTDYMLMLGANPAASNGSLMTAGDVLARLEKIKERGGKLVLVDPRRSETALYASEHQFIKPGSDALFLVGLIKVIFDKGLTNIDSRLPINGDIEALESLFEFFSMETISELTCIPITKIERIATEFATAEKAVCYGRMGISVQEFGALNHWLIQILNIITGSLDTEGGMMFTTPAIDLTDLGGRGSFNMYRSRVRNLPEVNKEFPTATMADEMLTPGEGQIKAFVVTAGNPVISSPNGVRLENALANLDFMVAVDFYINETTKHADIILPPSGPFEHALYDLIFTNFAVRNVSRFSEALFEKKSYMRSEFSIFNTLTHRIEELKSSKKGPIDRVKLKAKHKIQALMTVERAIDLMIRNGRYGHGMKSYITGGGLTLKKLKTHQHGLDLGPLEPRLPGKLFTKDKKINLIPEVMAEDLIRLNQYVERESTKAGTLTLISRRDLRTNNSWMHNSQRLVKGQNRCDLFVHPETANEYGIKTDEQVHITSAVGALKVTVAITDEIMPNVVSLPHGWGHHRKGMKMSVAQSSPGVSVNDITDHNFVDELSGNAALNGVPVSIQKIFNQ